MKEMFNLLKANKYRLTKQQYRTIKGQKLKDIEEIVKLCDTPCAKEILDIIGDE